MKKRSIGVISLVMVFGGLTAFLPVVSALAGTIDGVVVDRRTSQAIAHASLFVARWNEVNQEWEGAGECKADETGHFSFQSLRGGVHVVHAGKLDQWSFDFDNLGKSYFPVWYDGVPGADQNVDRATPIEIDNNGSETIQIRLVAAPASMAMQVTNRELPPEGGEAVFEIKVKNWTGSALKLRRCGLQSWINEQGAEENIPILPVDFTLAAGATEVFTYSVSVPARAMGNGDVFFQIGPWPSPAWRVYGLGQAELSKPQSSP